MENIELLSDILDKFEDGLLEAGSSARKVYLTEQHKKANQITWIHDHELAGHSLLRRMGMSAKRDLLRQPKEQI